MEISRTRSQTTQVKIVREIQSEENHHGQNRTDKKNRCEVGSSRLDQHRESEDSVRHLRIQKRLSNACSGLRAARPTQVQPCNRSLSHSNSGCRRYRAAAWPARVRGKTFEPGHHLGNAYGRKNTAAHSQHRNGVRARLSLSQG